MLGAGVGAVRKKKMLGAGMGRKKDFAGSPALVFLYVNINC